MQYAASNVLVSKDRTAILAVFASLVQELDLKTHDERYENQRQDQMVVAIKKKQKHCKSKSIQLMQKEY